MHHRAIVYVNFEIISVQILPSIEMQFSLCRKCVHLFFFANLITALLFLFVMLVVIVDSESFGSGQHE